MVEIAARNLDASVDRLVGRAVELRELERHLDALDRGQSGALALAGEPGIGKTRLLRELAARAERRGHLVLAGSAAELERDLPFSVFVDALDQYVAGLEPVRLMGLDAPTEVELAHVFPSLSGLADGREASPQVERYRSHRAVRLLLELLAQPKPLVLVLDDFHWADSGSVELLATLLRRLPADGVLLIVALRPHWMPERLGGALERAERAGRLTWVELGPLSPDEARELLPPALEADRAAAMYEEAGGNPFYLQQLGRSFQQAGRAAPAPSIALGDLEVPGAVLASLGQELAALSDRGRRVLEGAAAAGDPFDSELAAAAAELSSDATLDVVDELIRLDLLRQTDVPRRFRFRHPLVRRAVYEATPAGRRLREHERLGEALLARGAGAAARARHVERSAPHGDLGAVATLREAGEATSRLAPESAARWFDGALRLIPQSAPPEDRADLMLQRASALAAAGHFAESLEGLLEASAIVPEQSSALRTTVAISCARVERLVGRYPQANARLVRALGGLPEPDSVDSVRLMIELTLIEFYRSRYEAMAEWAARAVGAARLHGSPALTAEALAMPALAGALTGHTELARAHRAEAAALVDAMPDEELSLRIDAAGWLAAAELYLDLYAEADAHASRVLTLARVAPRADPFLRLYQILPRVWYVRGKLVEATHLLDDAIEAGRLLGTPPALAGNLFNRSVIAVAVGELDVAFATAERAVNLTRDLDEGFVTAWAAVRLASVLLETGQPLPAIELLLGRAGGENLALIPGGWRAYCLELLTRAWISLGRQREARRAAELATDAAVAMQLPLAAAWADRASAAVALHAGNPARAAELARASADAAEAVGAPIERGLSCTLAGRALAEAGRRDEAVQELERAAALLEACGALRYRKGAELELGRLGRRPYRRTRRGKTDGARIEALTERELQIARLVVDRMTNPEIAAHLFLSQKTVETHLRNIFNKMDVATRVDLARAVEHADVPNTGAGS